MREIVRPLNPSWPIPISSHCWCKTKSLAAINGSSLSACARPRWSATRPWSASTTRLALHSIMPRSQNWQPAVSSLNTHPCSSPAPPAPANRIWFRRSAIAHCGVVMMCCLSHTPNCWPNYMPRVPPTPSNGNCSNWPELMSSPSTISACDPCARLKMRTSMT